MLKNTDIHDIVRLGEGYYAEFKLSPPTKIRELAAEVCSFAHAAGGVISENEFGTRSHSRNPLIFGSFERIHMVEQIATGIGRIRSTIQKQGLPPPVFTLKGMFSVRFLRPSRVKTREKVLRLMRANDTITTFELAEAIGI